eukprot:g2117.t1
MSIELIPKQVKLQVISAAGLACTDMVGKSDPYAKVWWCMHEAHKTRALTNTSDPVWNDRSVTLDFPDSLLAKKHAELHIDVFDKDVGSADDFLGQVKLDCKLIVELGRKGEIVTRPLESNRLHKNANVQGTLTFWLAVVGDDGEAPPDTPRRGGGDAPPSCTAALCRDCTVQ